MGKPIKKVVMRKEVEQMEDELLAQAQTPEATPAQVQSEESETTETESTPVEPKPLEQVEPEVEEKATPPVTEELEDKQVENLSDKAQKRFKKLADENKELKGKLAQLEGLEVRREPIEVPIPTKPASNLPWETQEVPAITAEDYQKNVSDAARKAAREEVKIERLLTRVEDDAKTVEGKYPELNSENPEFDATLYSYVEDTFKAKFNSDNDYRLLDHVEKLMNFRSKAVEKARESAKAEVTAKVAKHQAEQAVTPSISAPPKEVNVEDKLRSAKTIEDLDALERDVR